MALSRKKKIIIAVAAVAVVAIVVIVSVLAGGKDAPEVTVVKVTTKPELKSVVTASGEIRPVKFINLTSEVSGRIEQIFVKAGDQVTQGQPLVRLDPTQTTVDRAKVDLSAAQRELKRQTDLVESGVSSRFEYDAARDRYEQSL